MGTHARTTLVVAAAIAIAGCTDDQSGRSVVNGGTISDPAASTVATTATTTTVARTDGTATTGQTGSGSRVRGLQRFADCSAFLDHVKGAALERVGPYGLDGLGQYSGPGMPMLEGDMARDFDMAAPATTAASATVSATAASADSMQPMGAPSDDSAGGVDFTGTNVQEAGVDEPDIIKTDGTRILTVSDRTMSYVDVSSGTPVVTDQITLEAGWGHELFFSGDRALLFTNNSDWAVPMPVDSIPVDSRPAGDSSRPADTWVASSLITEIDLSDPTDLAVTATMHIEGQYLSARAIGDQVRLAVASGPQALGWVYPSGPGSEDIAAEANRTVVERTTLADWTPSYEIEAGGTTTSGELLACDRMHQPAEFAGFEMISIVDLDLAGGLATSIATDDTTRAVGVLASGQTVYSSTDRMYVATNTWVPTEQRNGQWESDAEWETSIHAFAVDAGSPTTYVASGAVSGSLLNQFSLDEHEGFLRVITTSGAPWSVTPESESTLRVLSESGDQLVEVGSVGGLGRGERLYSARLMGDIGFAVTFRQIDPFYVLDLSDPTNPTMAGELKIPGFSSYLHPVGDVAETGLVLGVGQDATDTGQATGLKLSLFDVSDPAAPVERDVWTLGGSSSVAEYDHRSFQMIGSTAIVPTQSWSDNFFGATVFDISADGISERGRVDHADGAFTTDCAVIEQSQLQEGSELFWLAEAAVVSVCTPNQQGNADGGNREFAGWCNSVPASELEYWYGDPSVLEQDIASLGIGADDRIEMCYPDTYGQAIVRSIAIAEQLYTMSAMRLQANDLATLAVNSAVDIA